MNKCKPKKKEYLLFDVGGKCEHTDTWACWCADVDGNNCVPACVWMQMSIKNEK